MICIKKVDLIHDLYYKSKLKMSIQDMICIKKSRFKIWFVSKSRFKIFVLKSRLKI